MQFALQGVGSIMGGVIVMQAGNGGVEYIFTEKNFGQFASNEEVQCLHYCYSNAESHAYMLTVLAEASPRMLPGNSCHACNDLSADMLHDNLKGRSLSASLLMGDLATT